MGIRRLTCTIGHGKNSLTGVLQAYHNECADINKLPQDALSLVLLELRASVQADNPESRGWMRAASVCRHWRHVALATPELWTYNVLKKTELVDIFVRRSATLPMTISSWSPSSHIHSLGFYRGSILTEFIQPHHLRIAHVRFACYLTSMWNLLEPLQTELPNLESLELKSIFTYDACRDRVDCYWTYNPVSAPQQRLLRGVCLFQVFIPWDSFIFAGLRHLDLRGQVRDHNSDRVPSMDSFLDVLERCPQLEYLRIQHSGPTLDPNDPTPLAVGRKVALRNLRNIVLMNETRDITDLLQRLEVPEDTHYTIYLIPSKDFSDVAGMLPSINILNDVIFVHLGWVSDGPPGIDIEFGPFLEWSLMLHASTESNGELVVIFQSMEDPDDHETLCGCSQSQALFEALPQMLTNAALKWLAIMASYAKFTGESWHNVLSCYSKLQKLVVEFPFNDHEANATHLPTMLEAINGSSSPGMLLCPELEKLDLLDSTCGDDFAGTLRTFLQARVDAGLKLKLLRMGRPSTWKGTGEFAWPLVEDLVDSFEKLEN
ncbi:hypothetical protein QCA50_018698 [Cerrena zonata]|uniref:F-box domain-containing protein n=1 Tax=Cerrena zonata TaxID=2478898 RepID=A0AAW0FHE9_9APHY